MKDADITGQPITGVRYNDRQYTFYPYAGRMVSPKGGLLGYIKTAKGKLHGRFYTRGQWFLFEPAPEGNEPFLAHYTVGEDVTAKMVVNKLLESDEDVDPKTYMMSLRCKRDIVKALVAQYAVRHRWEHRPDTEVLLITFPKEVDFEHLLNRSGVAPANTMGISGGSKNYRLQFMWDKGYLDKLA